MELTSNIKRLILKLCFTFFASSVILWFSIFSYGLLYYLYIPAIAHAKPVHLKYDISCLNGEKCKYPHDNITLVKKGPALLSHGQIYAIELILDMPESERNIKQGMFMIRIDMLSENGEILKSSRRPAILHYRSPLFRMFYTLFFMPALLAGTVEEKQSLIVSLYEEYLEDYYKPAHYAYIEIEAKSAEVYSSTLRIHAHFTGLRYMMYYWPILSAIAGVGMNYFTFLIIFTFIWLRQIMNASQYVPQGNLDIREREIVEEIRRSVQKQRSQESFGAKLPSDPTKLQGIKTGSKLQADPMKSQEGEMDPEQLQTKQYQDFEASGSSGFVSSQEVPRTGIEDVILGDSEDDSSSSETTLRRRLPA